MNRSETIIELSKALVKFNSEVNKIAKDANNPFHKNTYATLDTIIDEVRPILSQNGLSIMQIPSGDGQNVTLKTLLLHESGEWLESEELTMKPVKNDPQAVGSCITYARRYSLAAFLSLNTGEDDDGNSATQGQGKTEAKSNSGNPQNIAQNNNTSDAASPKQKNAIRAKIKTISEWTGQTKEITEEAIKNKIGFTSFTELTKAQASEALKVLEKWENGYRPKGDQNANHN